MLAWSTQGRCQGVGTECLSILMSNFWFGFDLGNKTHLHWLKQLHFYRFFDTRSMFGLQYQTERDCGTPQVLTRMTPRLHRSQDSS